MMRPLRSPVRPNARAAATRLKRRLDCFAWTPAILWAATLAVVLAPMPLPFAVPGSFAPANATLRPPAAHTVFALNLLLFSGTALALSWFLALHAWALSQPIRDKSGAASATVGAGSLVTLVLATLSDGGQTLALTLCIYAPSLAVAYGLLGLAAGRMGAWWRVWLAGTAVGVTMLVTQLLYLDPDGRPPSEAVFALASLPIALAVSVWLVVWSIVPRPGLAGVTP